MKKKGFTLIELLAVIVIMAILVLILVPIISNVIDAARKAAFRETVNGVIESANNYVGEYILINHNDPIYPIEIICNGTECEDENGKKLEFKGKVPISGKVILESSELVRADLISDGVYCGSGTRGNVEVYNKCSELDHTNPIVDESKLNDIVISTTTNTLTLSMPIDLMYDDETGISRYNIDLYLGNNKVDSKKYEEPDVVFTNLKSGTEYKVVITGVNGNSGKTSIDRTATTLDITKPTISYTNDPVSDVNGYFRSQTLNVSYTKGNVENPEYYIRSGRVSTTNINVIGSCGTSTNPSECTTIDTNSIEADIWYKVSGNINVIYNVNASTESSLTAIIYDGVNYEGSDTKIIAKIEETPIAPTITGGSNDWTTSSRTISIATAGNAFTGVAKYQYYISISNSSQTGGSWEDVSGTSVTVSTEGTHYVFFRTVSIAGFTSGASNAEAVKVESTLTAPTITGGSNDWTTSSRTISVSTAGSATTGVAKYQYYISTASNSQTGGSWANVSGTSVAVSTEGTHYVFFRTVSAAGFTSAASNAETVKVESTLTAPTITGGSNDWTTSSRTISVSNAGSATTGVAKYQYYISTASNSQTGGSWANVSGTSVAVSTEGTHYVFFRTVSTAGFTSGASNAQTVKAEKTLTAPTITGGNNNYTNSSRTISVSNAGSATTGVSKYQYYISTSSSSQSGGSWANVSGTSVAVSTEGVHYVFFRTVSAAGFTSGASNAQTVKVDKTGPTTPTGGAIGSVSGSNSTGTIATAASGSTDSGVGGITYKYLVTNSSSAPAKTNTGFTTSRNFTRSCGKTYYGWAIAEDSLGNRSDVRSLGHTADGANSYSGWSACSKTCGGGTQTRTNSCALVTTGFSQSCNTQSCCTFTSQDFAYTGGMQSFTVPSGCGGTYTLEVWGAQGGGGTSAESGGGGLGGYSSGNVSLSAGTTIYIGVGGQGGPATEWATEACSAGGFNGGGRGCSYHHQTAGGGGATHIGTSNATLANTPSANVYIVAGGGGGQSGDAGTKPGGAGGGLEGGNGFTNGCGTPIAGTQSSGYAYGQGGAPSTRAGGGGGGGWYGGNPGWVCDAYWPSSGAGGSGYVGGVSNGSTVAGQRTGNGYARITRIGG